MNRISHRRANTAWFPLNEASAMFEHIEINNTEVVTTGWRESIGELFNGYNVKGPEIAV